MHADFYPPALFIQPLACTPKRIFTDQRPIFWGRKKVDRSANKCKRVHWILQRFSTRTDMASTWAGFSFAALYPPSNAPPCNALSKYANLSASYSSSSFRVSSMLPRTNSLICPLITSSLSCVIFSDMVCCLLSEWRAATPFYPRSASHVSLYTFLICITY